MSRVRIVLKRRMARAGGCGQKLLGIDMTNKKPIIIAGPCATESLQQVRIAMQEAKKRNIDFVRISLWKPRTLPGYEGLKDDGIPLLVEAARMGLNPGTEIMIPEHAKRIMEEVLPALQPNGKLLLWVGARNQNHFLQKEISKIVASDTSKRTFLMMKNQPWRNKQHWDGIVLHTLEGGIDKDHLLLCHRGFSPWDGNPNEYRNVPDFEMAEKMKEQTGLPMIFDPSHTGGTVDKVMHLIKESSTHLFDGMIIEVHHNPAEALCDGKQSLTWEQFDSVMHQIGVN